MALGAFKRRASFRRCSHNEEVGADTTLVIIHWFRLFLAKIRVRVRVRVTSPGFATPGSMKCAVQVWSGRWTVVKCAFQTWSRRGPGRTRPARSSCGVGPRGVESRCGPLGAPSPTHYNVPLGNMCMGRSQNRCQATIRKHFLDEVGPLQASLKPLIFS